MALTPRARLREMLRQLERYAGLRPCDGPPSRPIAPPHDREINWHGRPLRPQRPSAERIAAAASANEKIAALAGSANRTEQAPE
jgi:hypothetical protein